MNFEKLAKRIIKYLKKNDIECYLWHAATTGSAYIRFGDCRMGSIRLGDHKGRSQYGYMWNVRSDFPKGHNKWHKIDNRWRFYTHTTNWIELVPLIISKKNKIDSWGPTTQTYYVPEHKKKKKSYERK